MTNCRKLLNLNAVRFKGQIMLEPCFTKETVLGILNRDDTVRNSLFPHHVHLPLHSMVHEVDVVDCKFL